MICISWRGQHPQDHLAWVMAGQLHPGEPFLDNNCSNIYSTNSPAALQLKILIQQWSLQYENKLYIINTEDQMRNKTGVQFSLQAKFHATDHQVHCVSSSRAPLRAKIRHKLYFSGCNSLMKRGKLIYFFPAPFHNQLKRQRGGRFILKGVVTKREKSIKSHLTFFGVQLKLSGLSTCFYHGG